MLWLFLQQTDQPHWVDVVFLCKFNGTAFFITLELSDSQLLRLLAQTGNIQQRAGRIGQQAKAVD
ncbi:hypothetical protein D3C81_1873710 [compost metagenome]